VVQTPTWADIQGGQKEPWRNNGDREGKALVCVHCNDIGRMKGRWEKDRGEREREREERMGWVKGGISVVVVEGDAQTLFHRFAIVSFPLLSVERERERTHTADSCPSASSRVDS
jgi:hypothetical protein